MPKSSTQCISCVSTLAFCQLLWTCPWCLPGRDQQWGRHPCAMIVAHMGSAGVSPAKNPRVLPQESEVSVGRPIAGQALLHPKRRL